MTQIGRYLKVSNHTITVKLGCLKMLLHYLLWPSQPKCRWWLNSVSQSPIPPTNWIYRLPNIFTISVHTLCMGLGRKPGRWWRLSWSSSIHRYYVSIYLGQCLHWSVSIQVTAQIVMWWKTSIVPFPPPGKGTRMYPGNYPGNFSW